MADNAQERLPRLLALVPWLSTRPGVTFSETADHFGITVDQLTTDLYQLVVCGLPGYGPDQLVDIDFYDSERIWVNDPQTLRKPLNLTAEEITAISIALRLLAQIPGLQYQDDLEQLIIKLDNAGAKSADHAKQDFIQITPQVDPALRELIADSLAHNRKIHFVYHSGSDSVTDRVVSPIKVFAVDDYFYLDAYCDQAEARRLFRLDRIHDAQLLEQRSHVATSHESTPNLGVLSTAPRALLEVEPFNAWLAQEPWVEVVQQEPLRISVPYLSDDWLIHWVLSIGGGVRILEPEQAVDHLTSLIQSSISRIISKD